MNPNNWKLNGKVVATGVVLLLLFGGGFILLILYATPYFYSKHPNASQNIVGDSIDRITYTVQDTITISNDSVIAHKVIFTELPQANPSTDPTIEDLGTFGDSAGFWNAIFSALAMIAVVITLYYQFHKDRRDEERIAIAQFQDQFFKMISILSEIVSELRIPRNDQHGFDYPFPEETGYYMQEGDATQPQVSTTPHRISDSDRDITGRACFNYIYHEKPEEKNVGQYLANETRGNQNAIASEQLYSSLRNIIGNHFDHYFRTIYRILKFIDDFDLENCNNKKMEEVKDLCADLLRAQLSTFELALIYYNGLYPTFRNTSKRLYEKYCIFDNLDPQTLILRSERDYYEYVRTNHKNKEDYNQTIHYDFTAFTSQNSTNSTSIPLTATTGKLIHLWVRIKNWLPRNFISEANSSSQVHEETYHDIHRIFSIIKGNEQKILTNKQIRSLGRISEKRMKVALRYLKENQFISCNKCNKGTKYKVLKNYP